MCFFPLSEFKTVAFADKQIFKCNSQFLFFPGDLSHFFPSLSHRLVERLWTLFSMFAPLISSSFYELVPSRIDGRLWMVLLLFILLLLLSKRLLLLLLWRRRPSLNGCLVLLVVFFFSRTSIPPAEIRWSLPPGRREQIRYFSYSFFVRLKLKTRITGVRGSFP